MKHRRHLTPDERQAVLEMCHSGNSQRAVADAFDIGQSSVSRIVQSDGTYLRGRPVAVPGQRWCSKCRSFKATDEFWRNSALQDGLCGACKGCMSDQHSKNRASMRYRAARVYGITLEHYDELRAAATVCPICGSYKTLHLDHDAETGKLREFICGLCNRGLGLFKHDPDLLQSAIAYLGKHQ